MLRKLSLISALFFVAACATQTPAVSEANSNNKTEIANEETKDGKIICKRTQTVGTNFKRKQCWTKEEYAEEKRLSKEALENAQRSGMIGPEGR